MMARAANGRCHHPAARDEPLAGSAGDGSAAGCGGSEPLAGKELLLISAIRASKFDSFFLMYFFSDLELTGLCLCVMHACIYFYDMLDFCLYASI